MRGSVYKRGKAWWVKVELGTDENGKRIRHQQRGGATKKEAEAVLTQIQARVDSGTYVEPTKQTVGRFLAESWLPAIRETVRPSTMDSYRMLVSKHIAPALGSTRLQSLTPARLNAFYADLLAGGRVDGKGGLSPKTVRNVHVVLHRALRDAVRWSLIPRNPAEYADPPKLTDSGRKEMQTWTAQELRTFLEQVADDRLYAAFLLAASTGMRRGEVLGLRWSDVSLDLSRLSVRQTLITTDYRLEFSTPKTNKGRRSIALDATTLAGLREHRKAQLEERMAVGEGFQDHGLVFCKVDGSPLHPDLFSQTFDRYVVRSGLPRVRLHDLRHTHATLALQAGVHPKVVSERLGHSTVAFTLDVYSHAIPAMQEEAAETVASLVFREGR
jgi:integrase